MIPPRNWVQGLLIACVLTCCVQRSSAAQDQAAEGTSFGLDPAAQRYRLGQGLPLGDGFALGGYGTVSVGKDENADWRAGLDSLSGFLWWDDGKRWNFFSELELKDSNVPEPGIETSSRAEVELERFYVDYAQSDLLKLRLGKFLTPVGRWNLIHASPLVLTTSRPLITERTFPTNATGAMVYGVLPWTAQGIEYSVYYSPGSELAPDPQIDTFKEAVGGHLSFTPLPYTQLGLSYVSFEQKHTPDESKNLYGLDFIWSRHRWELSGEFHYRMADRHLVSRDEQGLYIQAVAPLSERLYGVVRFENFQRSDTHSNLNLYIGGFNYRLRQAVVVKAEYSHATHIDPDTDLDVHEGFLASIAVLF